MRYPTPMISHSNDNTFPIITFLTIKLIVKNIENIRIITFPHKA